jgi:hypothetical protein
MKIELLYNRKDGVSIVVNNKYQIYLSDWVVYKLWGDCDTNIPMYVFNYIEKLKKKVGDSQFINLTKLIK